MTTDRLPSDWRTQPDHVLENWLEFSVDNTEHDDVVDELARRTNNRAAARVVARDIRRRNAAVLADIRRNNGTTRHVLAGDIPHALTDAEFDEVTSRAFREFDQLAATLEADEPTDDPLEAFGNAIAAAVNELAEQLRPKIQQAADTIQDLITTIREAVDVIDAEHTDTTENGEPT